MAPTNFPTIKLAINGTSFSDIPPEYIQELVFDDQLSGSYTVEVVLHDEFYTRVEDAIFGEVVEQGLIPMVCSFGYLIDGELVESDVLRCYISHYLPTFSAGLDLRIRAYSAGVGKNVQFSEPLSFINAPYHEIVKSCAKAMLGEGTDLSFIQETREGQNYTGSTEPFGTVMNFLKKEIVQDAVAQDGRTGFYLGFQDDVQYPGQFGEGDSLKPSALRFGTRQFIAEKNLERREEIPTFVWLSGKQDSDVIEFRPDFQGDLLGGYGTVGTKFVGWDALNKRPVTVPVNPVSAAKEKRIADYLAKGAAVVSMGKEETSTLFQGLGSLARERFASFLDSQRAWLFEQLFGEAKQNDVSREEAVPFSARADLKSGDLDSLRDRAYSRWNKLAETVVEGDLRLSGSERTVRLRAGDLIRVLTIIPSSQRVHWSSGLWWIDSVRHEITTGYEVVCRLVRNSNADGIEEVPEGVNFV